MLHPGPVECVSIEFLPSDLENDEQFWAANDWAARKMFAIDWSAKECGLNSGYHCCCVKAKTKTPFPVMPSPVFSNLRS